MNFFEDLGKGKESNMFTDMFKSIWESLSSLRKNVENTLDSRFNSELKKTTEEFNSQLGDLTSSIDTSDKDISEEEKEQIEKFKQYDDFEKFYDWLDWFKKETWILTTPNWYNSVQAQFLHDFLALYQIDEDSEWEIVEGWLTKKEIIESVNQMEDLKKKIEKDDKLKKVVIDICWLYKGKTIWEIIEAYEWLLKEGKNQDTENVKIKLWITENNPEDEEAEDTEDEDIENEDENEDEEENENKNNE